MSTDQTPALARATEALKPHQDRATQRTSWGEKSIPMLTLTADAAARTAVSAALHDPDDPDWLTKVIANVRASLVGRDPAVVDRLTAVAVRAALLGTEVSP